MGISQSGHTGPRHLPIHILQIAFSGCALMATIPLAFDHFSTGFIMLWGFLVVLLALSTYAAHRSRRAEFTTPHQDR